MITDLELLEIEIDTLWATDHRGRLIGSRAWEGGSVPYLVIAVSTRGQTMAIGDQVPDDLALELQAAVAGEPPSPDPAAPPTFMNECERLLRGSSLRVVRSGSPAYVIPGGAAFQSAAKIRRSNGGASEELGSLVPERAGWSAADWKLLLEGSFGPWAMATIEERVVAICHSARLTDRGAEAGVWTDPDFRGQGHAAAVTAAWASVLAPSGQHLFYSTSAGNVSSQRVATRLGLQLIGWRWQLSDPSPV